MKKLLVFVLLLVPVMLGAQTRVLINRIDDQTGSLIKHQIRLEKGNWNDKPLLLQSPQRSGASFNIILDDSAFTFSQDAEKVVDGSIINKTDHVIRMICERTHLRIPANWSSNVCLGSCNASSLYVLPVNRANDLQPSADTKQFHFHVVAPKDAEVSDSIIDYIKLTALTGDPSDTVAFLMKGVLIPQSGVQVQQKQNSTNPKITSIYPSPLIQGNAIKVKVSSPRESNLSYSIYDGIGRVVALGVTRQRIGLGDNTVTIGSLDELVNGSYMLKFNFGDGSSDTHFFQILR